MKWSRPIGSVIVDDRGWLPRVRRGNVVREKAKALVAYQDRTKLGLEARLVSMMDEPHSLP